MCNGKGETTTVRCIEGCTSSFERNNYFCGKLMTERDFRTEQLYHMGKQRLHNSFLHGWGTVACLKVDPHPVCPNLRIIVRSGLAIDCYGREIRVPCDVQAELESYRDAEDESNTKPEKLLICLSYRECKTEPVTAFIDTCGCTEVCEPNRIAETYRIEVLTEDDFKTIVPAHQFYSKIVSGKKVISIPDRIVDTGGSWDQFDSGIVDGSITIRTSAGSHTVPDVGTLLSVDALITDINNSSIATIVHDPDSDKFTLESTDPEEILILEQTGRNPFFTEIKMPAYHSEYKKVINPCPGCPDNTKIILAVIEGYNNITENNLDPDHADFKTAAYTIDNFTYRKAAPNIEFMDRVIHYVMKKGL